MRFCAQRLIACLAVLLAASAAGGSLSGKFSDGKLTVDLALVTVVCCRADAPAGEWTKLSAGPAPAAPDIATILGDNAKVYEFPDGTGSITLAEGWKTQAASAVSPVFVEGPDDQRIFINNGHIVSTPDSPAVRQIQRNQEMMRRMGRNPPPAPFILTADFTDPVQAIQDLTPQLSQYSQANGYRTVYDTQTGLSTSVDLSNVDAVVDSLNQAALDPHRFVQIPLRDEQDPRYGR